VKRREFITLVSGAVAWPLAASAQQLERVRRIGLLMQYAEEDAEAQNRLAALRRGLQELGWIEGRNLQIDYRWGSADAESTRRYTAELIALAPDLLIANGGSILGPVQQVTRSVPIVFVSVVDPVGAGFVQSLARPGGNATGFTQFEYGIAGKWLELLRQVAPRITRALVIRDPSSTAGIGQFAAIQAVAPGFGVELSPADVRDVSEIERALTDFARTPNSGLIVVVSALAVIHREQIVKLAARYHLPTVYPQRPFVVSGGLVSYGPDLVDPYWRAAAYVDRILKGEKPADLPVQAPTKYELVINLNTAKSFGLDLPAQLLATADEAIE
jgi:putative tryptophan/tyrosine transport system substrate-binding protein